MKTRFNLNRRTVVAAMLGLPAAAAAAFALQRQRPNTLPQSLPNNESERRILDVIADYDRRQRAGSLSVPFEDGRFLRILAESIGAANIVEIGTSFGYSGLWLSLAL